MKSHKLIINSAEVKTRALYLIGNLDIEKPREVIIREHKADRSAAQNSTYWLFLTHIGDELGETKGDLHERYKGKFLVPIYERDDPEYAEMIAALRTLYREDKTMAELLHKKIVKLTSTTKASVKQFCEYLTDIERDANGMNIFLPRNDDYMLALGVKGES